MNFQLFLKRRGRQINKNEKQRRRANNKIRPNAERGIPFQKIAHQQIQQVIGHMADDSGPHRTQNHRQIAKHQPRRQRAEKVRRAAVDHGKAQGRNIDGRQLALGLLRRKHRTAKKQFLDQSGQNRHDQNDQNRFLTAIPCKRPISGILRQGMIRKERQQIIQEKG